MNAFSSIFRVILPMNFLFGSFLVYFGSHGIAAENVARPFRLGMFKMNQAYDSQKPLAVADSAGYAIVGDVIYGTFDNTRYQAWNFKQHKHVWWLPTDGESTSPPLMVENTLFFSTRSGKVYSVNAATGLKNWEIALDSYVERPLVFSGGQLYLVTVGQVAYSLDANSGKRLWVYDAGFPEHITVRRPPAPLVFEDRMIFGIASGELVALKANDGKVSWRYNPLYVDGRFHDPVGEMILSNGKLLIARYDGLVAQIDMGPDRKVVWQDKTTSVSTSTFRGGRYYVGLVSGDVVAYDTSNGRVIWRTNTAATPSFISVGETTIYSVATDGRMFALDMSSGDIIWIEDLGSRAFVMYMVIDSKNGRIVWRHLWRIHRCLVGASCQITSMR
ncbi:MAG: PQQ-binding-like beta-propeller repeat protein [Proteobacteria bacterium]|nr:PQQ-binding-like beta-propeller repeat protein [Pseudomonadota bacterium]